MTIALILALPLAAQTIGERGEPLPEPPRPKTLSIRESTFSSVLTRAKATYRREADSQSFLLESNEGEPVVEWQIGGEARPLREDVPAPARVVEKRVKLIPHEDKLFLKIEIFHKSARDRAEEEIRFSGTYQATTMEGTWTDYREGGKLKVRIAAADHERYLAAMQNAFFGEAALVRHVESYRKKILGLLERRVSASGATTSQDIEMLKALVTIVKAHPESFVVKATPSHQSDPEIFEIEGDTMRSTTEKQTTTLRFEGKLPAVMPGPAAP